MPVLLLVILVLCRRELYGVAVFGILPAGVSRLSCVTFGCDTHVLFLSGVQC